MFHTFQNQSNIDLEEGQRQDNRILREQNFDFEVSDLPIDPCIRIEVSTALDLITEKRDKNIELICST